MISCEIKRSILIKISRYYVLDNIGCTVASVRTSSVQEMTTNLLINERLPGAISLN